MKFCSVQGVLVLVASLLILQVAASRRNICFNRYGCGVNVRLSAAAVCRHFAATEVSCRSCHCQTPSSLRCRRLCAFREKIRACAREFLCPPTTVETTVATTVASSEATTLSTSPVTTVIGCKVMYTQCPPKRIPCGIGGSCLPVCPADEDTLSICPGALKCCISVLGV